jgi:hypothetical protein
MQLREAEDLKRKGKLAFNADWHIGVSVLFFER